MHEIERHRIILGEVAERPVVTVTQLVELTGASEATIRRDIGWDISAAAIYRPRATQNLVFRLSGAILQAGTGFRDLFFNNDRDRQYYSILFNAILSY